MSLTIFECDIIKAKPDESPIVVCSAGHYFLGL